MRQYLSVSRSLYTEACNEMPNRCRRYVKWGDLEARFDGSAVAMGSRRQYGCGACRWAMKKFATKTVINPWVGDKNAMKSAARAGAVPVRLSHGEIANQFNRKILPTRPLVEQLRSPNGYAWDQNQTPASLLTINIIWKIENDHSRSLILPSSETDTRRTDPSNITIATNAPISAMFWPGAVDAYHRLLSKTLSQLKKAAEEYGADLNSGITPNDLSLDAANVTWQTNPSIVYATTCTIHCSGKTRLNLLHLRSWRDL